ncbi:hypothetical protein IDH17_03255 [Pelagibacterales bacterium SAG-MED37]|nr:hypothetical protein [Pelagibacterales bacterium SAG-MED37]
MFKNLFILACILLLTNCATPTSAFLGPVFTGAKTGSVYQASLSYGSNRIIDKMRKVKQNNFQEMNSVTSDLSTNDRNPLVLIAHKVSKIEISEVKEPEPLP